MAESSGEASDTSVGSKNNTKNCAVDKFKSGKLCQVLLDGLFGGGFQISRIAAHSSGDFHDLVDPERGVDNRDHAAFVTKRGKVFINVSLRRSSVWTFLRETNGNSQPRKIER